MVAADPEAAARAARQAETRQGVWVGQSTEHGIKDIFIRTEAPNALWFDASIDRIADGLGLLGDTSTKDVRRGRAVGVLAQPQQALDLFVKAAAATPDRSRPAPDAGCDPTAASAGSQRPSGRQARVLDCRPPATLYVHIGADAVTRDEGGVARVEGVGAVTVDQIRQWLGHCNVTVKPVIDLSNQAPVDAYEIPDRLREATHLRSQVDVFPFATSQSRAHEIDHTRPYQDPGNGGPPGQTGLDNLGPMTRFHHRIKTHGRWQVVQPANGVFIWRSPHGRVFVVDSTGTSRAFPAA